MLQSQFMFSHLTQDRADVEVDVGWIEHLQTFVHALIAKVQVIVFNFKCLFEIAKSRSEFFGSSENASKVVVSYCSVLISLVR